MHLGKALYFIWLSNLLEDDHKLSDDMRMSQGSLTEEIISNSKLLNNYFRRMKSEQKI
jgi:hypothetical protein